jgi:hypothetical protein
MAEPYAEAIDLLECWFEENGIPVFGGNSVEGFMDGNGWSMDLYKPGEVGNSSWEVALFIDRAFPNPIIRVGFSDPKFFEKLKEGFNGLC